MLRQHEVQTFDEDGRPVVYEPVTTIRRQRLDVTPSQVVSAVVGVASLAFGIFALARAGIDRPLSDPQVQVFGFTHTAAIGIVEVALAAVLLMCAFSPATRGLSGLIGLALVAAGLVLLAGSPELLADLHTESDLGWIGVAGGAALLLAALVAPRRQVL